MKRSESISHIKKKINWNEIDLNYIENLISICADEDLDSKFRKSPLLGDITTSACNIKGVNKAKLVTRENIICCGLNIYPHIFKIFDTLNLKFEKNCSDGEELSEGSLIGTISGNAAEILLVERTLLNLIQKLSGISTTTNQLVNKIKQYNVGLLDTRKTTPGLRILEKYATSCGGSFNHRYGLSDRILIKDNHLAFNSIKSVESFIDFVKNIRKNHPNEFIQVEVDSVDFAISLTHTDVDAVLLDNFSYRDIIHVKQFIDKDIIIELSGGITSDNIESFAACRPDFISSGYPTHSSRWVDIGLDWSE